MKSAHTISKKLTKERLDDIRGKLKQAAQKPERLPDASPRYEFVQRKISRKRAKAIRKKEIDALKSDLAQLQKKPLQTYEGYYKRLTPSDAGYENASWTRRLLSRPSVWCDLP